MPTYIKGAVLRDTLYGRIRQGQCVVHENSTPIDIIIKEYRLWQVNQHITRDGQTIYEDANNELTVHSKLDHRHIVRLYDTIYQNDKIYAIMEYCSIGELFTLIKNQQFNHNKTKQYFIQLIQAIDYIHDVHNVCHRDISLENILLDINDNLKLCDFGLCSINTDHIDDGKRVGKLKYMAPEVYAKESYNPKSADIWSCGVVLFIMLTGVFPWDIPSVEDTRCIQACRGADAIHAMIEHWKLPAVDKDAVDLLSQIFTAPDKRLNTKQILQHIYVTKQDNVDMSIENTAVNYNSNTIIHQTPNRTITLNKLNTPSIQYAAELNQRDKYFSPAVSRSASYTFSPPASSTSSRIATSPISNLGSPSVSYDNNTHTMNCQISLANTFAAVAS